MSIGKLDRPLHGFTFDPILSHNIETHDINEVTIKHPWEENLRPGPIKDHLTGVVAIFAANNMLEDFVNISTVFGSSLVMNQD